MKLKLYSSAFLLCICINLSFAQWFDPKTDTLGFGHDLVGLAATDQNTWIAAGGNSSVYRTTDGWQTFTRLNTSIYTSVRTASAGYNGFFAIHTSPDLWISNNNGLNWSIGGGSGIEYLNMLDSAYGIGTYGCGVLRTTNGGQNWSTLGSVCNNNNSMWGISFPDKKHGFVCGNNSVFASTSDSGATWVDIHTNASFASSGIAYDVFFVDQNIGYVTRGENSSGCSIKKTIDGGLTWTDLSSNFQSVAGTSNKNMRLYFLDANTGYVTHGGKIYKTINGGLNWNLEHTHPRLNPDVYTYSNVKRKGNNLVFSGDGCMISVFKLSSTSGLPDNHMNQLTIHCYPNPANEQVNIKTNSTIVKVELVDLLGTVVFSLPNGTQSQNVEINTAALSAGIYFVKITDKKGNGNSAKIVVEH
jgi:photosystem II stability/assembly factor-like uncharacterized protein